MIFWFSKTSLVVNFSFLLFVTGNLQGLHNIHGNFNVPNMQGTLGSRTTTINNISSSNVPQPSGNLSGGRFASNNLPVALSQVVVVSASCTYSASNVWFTFLL